MDIIIIQYLSLRSVSLTVFLIKHDFLESFSMSSFSQLSCTLIPNFLYIFVYALQYNYIE